MRYFSFLLACVGLATATSVPARAQTGGTATVHATIKWQGYAEVPTQNARKQKVPTFEKAFHGRGEQVGSYGLRIEGAVDQGQLANLVYEPFPAADAKLFDAGRLPTGPDPQLVQGTEMKRPVTHLTVRTVRRNSQTGQPERLVSFDYVYSASSANLAARGARVTRQHVPYSVLRSGDWFKVGVAESGIYKVDLATLTALGMNTQGLDPSRIRIYGNSTGVLPQANDAERPDDLEENSVLFVGDGNPSFEPNEYLLFYSPGAHTWEASGSQFRHRNNIYTDTTYYFITVGNTPGRRVATVAPPTAGGTVANITTFSDRQFHEHDLVNLLRSGRQWLGEGFSPNSQQAFTFNIPDLVPGAPLRVTSSVASVTKNPHTATFRLGVSGSANGAQTNLGLQPITYRPDGSYSAIAVLGTTTHQIPLPAGVGPEVRVNLSYNTTDPTGNGYLDYLEVNAMRQLRLSGDQLEFRSLENIAPGAVSRFVLSNATGAAVWDVTNPREARAMVLDAGSFLARTEALREYVAFRPAGNFPAPRRFGRVANQNLHALNTNPSELLDLIIVTYPPFKAQAERLAAHRRNRHGLKTAVVTTTEVYNEYSSGGQDVTAIRDLMKQLYDLAPAGKQMHLLLFGDASFDYKSDPFNSKDAAHRPQWWRDRVPFKTDADFDRANQNYVPTYESRESMVPFYGPGAFGQASYSSDDYYALLDDDEGEWNEMAPGRELLDIGVGRLPVRAPKGSPTSAQYAEQMVTKIISYDNPASYGKWRNRVTMTADDGNGGIFVNDSEVITRSIQTNNPAYNVRKVYLDLFPQLTVAAGQRSPECNRTLDESIEQGSLIVNYLGHGGPKGWTDEQIVTNASVMGLQNATNLTFMVTGTCDFSTYDDPDIISAGEQVLTDNANGGAVGLFTTTRVVDAGANAGLNNAFYNRVFRPINGKMPSIGTVVMLGKNDYPGPGIPGSINNRNYTLLADPSMVLAYPEQTVTLDSIKRLVASRWVRADTLQALSRVRLRGRVLNGGTLNSGFNGTAQITIYDKPTTVMTLGDEAQGNPTSGDAPAPVRIQENIIYGGQASVVNGEYTVTFVVPKDINYNIAGGLGKVSLYAFDAGNRVDANGYRFPAVGGADATAPRDDTPPVISLFMNDKSFVFGGTTGQNATLIAELSDDNGINTTGAGIGHEITATLDRDPRKLVILNDTYVAKLDNFKAGEVDYLFKDLAPGPHSLRVKAWDTYNNSSESEIEFVVAHNEQLALNHVLNYPNPFAGVTTFRFDHNRAGDDLDVQVQIFTVAGRLVRTLSATVPGSESSQKSISWNGRDEYDDQLARGVYVYRISVRSPNHGTATKYEKLVILN